MGQELVLAGQTITPVVLNRIYGMADSVSHTVNNNTFANISSAYPIPAGDASPGTAYRITVFGNGTWGSTQQALTLALDLASTDIGIEPAVASTVFAASAAFDFEITGTLVCVTSGSSGTWLGSLRGILTQSTNPVLPGTAADNTVTFAATVHTPVTQDTTIADILAIQAKWASATGSPTMSCTGTLFEKVN